MSSFKGVILSSICRIVMVHVNIFSVFTIDALGASGQSASSS